MKRTKTEKDNYQDETGQLKRRICSITLKSALVLAVFFLIIQENSIAKGLVLGTLCSIINFLLLGVSIPMTLGHTRYRAGFIGLISILARYALLAIPLIIGIKLESFNFVAVVIGVFAVQIVTLIEHLVIRPMFFEN
jgi:hypothetical protein